MSASSTDFESAASTIPPLRRCQPRTAGPATIGNLAAAVNAAADFRVRALGCRTLFLSGRPERGTIAGMRVRCLFGFPVTLQRLAFSFWLACVAAPATAAADPASEDSAATDNAEPLPPAPVPPPAANDVRAATTDALYDFTLLADRDPAYRALQQAFAHKRWQVVQNLAVEVAQKAAQPAVAQAAWLMLAEALQARQQWPQAEKAWQVLAQSGPLAQRARLKLAQLALRRADTADALVQLAAIAPWHVARDEANLQMATIELARGNAGPARDALERIDAAQLTREERAQYLLLQAELAFRQARPADAERLLVQAWLLDVGELSSRAAVQLGQMAKAPTAADQIERILRRREFKAGQTALWLREADAFTEAGSALRLYVRGALWGRDKPTRPQAIAALRQAVAKFEDALGKARATYALADTLGKTGADEQAIAELAQVPALLRDDTSPASAELQARALARLHRLYSAIAAPEQADAVLQRLLDNHPDAQERELVVWGLGWQRWLAKDYPKALELFVQLEKEHGNQWTGAQQPWRAKAIYWQARCLHQMGQTEAALQAWAGIANLYAQTYYGIIALDRVREIDPGRADQLRGPPPSPLTADVPPPSLDRLRVTRDRLLDEAVLLVRIGWPSEAQTLLRRQLGHGLPRDGVHLLATLYELGGNKAMAYGVMSRQTRRAARPDDSTAQMWRQSFPRAFFDESALAAGGAGINKAFLYAIMRHESSFVPTTVSKAGAMGLVQLLPGVAKNIADLHKASYGGPNSLLRPHTNLTLGALYLAQLVNFYKGSVPLAAAGYNAGPYAVRDWIKRWQGQPTDVFVEAIPFPATRAYVMQVTATAQTYAWLYPEWQELRRDELARVPTVPVQLGPFMQLPPPAPPQTAGDFGTFTAE